MNCPLCNKECQEDWTFCPYCTSTLPKVVKEPSKPKKKQSVQHEKLDEPADTPRKSKIKIFLAIVAILAGFVGFSMWNTAQEAQQAVLQTQQLLATGFQDNIEDLSKVNWGKIDEAKSVFGKVSQLKRSDVEALKIEIAQREAGIQILSIQKLYSHNSKDFEWLNKSKETLKSISNSFRYYKHASNMMGKIDESLDVAYLEKAKQSLKNMQVKEVWANLAQITEKSKVKAEAEDLRDKTIEIEKEAEKIAKQVLRVQYAKTLEEMFVKQGMDVYVSVSGSDSEYINLKYVLWSRPLARKFAEEGGIYSAAKSLGFKRLKFDSGYRESWWWDL